MAKLSPERVAEVRADFEAYLTQKCRTPLDELKKASDSYTHPRTAFRWGCALTAVEMMLTPHWTDNHIKQEGDEFVGYDEAGLEHCRNTNRDTVRDILVVYSASLAQPR